MFGRISGKVSQLAERLDWLPLVLTRLAIGTVFAQSGWGKLHNLPKVVSFFTDLGLPFARFQAPVVAGFEFVCGCALLAGFFTRLAALPLIAIAGVALLTAKRAEIEGFGDLMGLQEYLMIVLLLWLATRGAGPLSLDRARSRSARR